VSAKILDGKILAAQVKEGIKTDAVAAKREAGRDIRIVSVLVGDEECALKYADAQKKVADEIGIIYDLARFPQDVTQADLQAAITQLSRDPTTTGVMVHKPLPEKINEQAVFNCIDPLKDIEGMNAKNIGNIVLGRGQILPCTAAAVMEHLKAAGIALRGKEAVVVGASEIVGKPLALLLLQEMATVTVCHIATTEAGKLKDHVRRADVVVVAVGRPNLITGGMIKDGAVVIDVGMNHVDGKMVGDVEFETVAPKASMMTPVPGGVGPVTVMMLMRNAIEAFRLQQQQESS